MVGGVLPYILPLTNTPIHCNVKKKPNLKQKEQNNETNMILTAIKHV